MNGFVRVSTKKDSRGTTHVYPEFVTRGKDIMTKGGKFYAIYDEESGLWITSQDAAIDIIDRALVEFADSHYSKADNGAYVGDDGKVVIDYLYINSTRQLKAFREWLSLLPPNHNYHQLDNVITRADENTTLKDYRSKRLSYVIEEGKRDSYDLFMETCYAPEEREKLEWAVGSILCGESSKYQKFIAVYGKPGTGKSTFFNIMEDLFEGYWSVIDVDALVSRNNQFGTAALKDNPLVCIQHDADLSKIEKNDVLNSIVSHEKIYINEKRKEQYPLKLMSMIFIGTNEVVNISDTRQGITRRMIDVYPTGDVLPGDVYDEVKRGMRFELGAIAQHCIDVYRSVNPLKYQKYKPVKMIKKSNVYTNFVSERYFDLCDESNDPITARDLYRMFKDYMSESGYQHIPTLARFKEIMLDFYNDFKERERVNGRQLRSVFIGFKKDCLDETMSCINVTEKKTSDEGNVDSVRDENSGKKRFVLKDFTKIVKENPLQMFLKNQPAQYSSENGTPSKSWSRCTTKLVDIDPFKEHYVKPPQDLICVDFDLRGPDGKKSKERNLEAIQSWPLTYAEFSKSGCGIHLYYIYDGDVTKLSRVFDENIEIKVFTGNSSLRRKLGESNMAQIAHISSGLPLREESKMVKFDTLTNERALRTVIIKNLKKEYHPATKPSIDFIYKVLDDAYKSGMHYDVSDLENRIIAFANNSTNNSKYCLGLVGKMKFQSDDVSDYVEAASDTVVFYDVEVFPNVFIVCWKEQGKDKPVHTMINPKPNEIEALLKYKLIGFNCRKYDNHLMYARLMGYTNQGLYDISKRLIHGDSKAALAASFSEAYNMSYADVYDFAKDKKSLKKWEIDLGIHHLENSYPWDEDLPVDKWNEVAEYCCNDVIATEEVFNFCGADFIAREIIADISGLTINHTTRQHATKIIFGNDKKPELVYTHLEEQFPGYKFDKFGIDPSEYNGYDPNDKKTWNTGGRSVYLGEDPSEGGFVRAEPGIYYYVGLLDITSMHPSSIIALNLFGKYTAKFKELVDARVAIKHKDFETARQMFEGKLSKWLEDETKAAALADALKLVINSIYGFTSATFDNPFKDARNVDNIVAKRGALFMIKLRKTLKDMGIDVVHVKTDSVKIPNITPDIVKFVQEFGQKYGYSFEHESTYEKMCLINGSTYVAKVLDGKHAGEWVTVAAQFQHPYVKKTLFTKEKLEFKDYCEVKEVKTSMVLDFNEGLGEGEHNYQYIGRIGSFIPVKEGCGGGLLLRDRGKLYDQMYAEWEANPYYDENQCPRRLVGTKRPPPEKYVSATGAGDFRWVDSETLKNLPFEEFIKKVDMRYFNKLTDEAIDAINQYGDFEEFMNYRYSESAAIEEDIAAHEYPREEDNPYVMVGIDDGYPF